MKRLPSFLLILMFFASTLFAQENLLHDPGMELIGEDSSPWFLRDKSTVLTNPDGTRSLRIEADEFGTCGAMQVVHFDPPIRAPFRFGGRAKLDEKAICSGKGSPDFDVYLDVFYEDGTTLWGVKAIFDPETLGWQTAEAMLWPEKPMDRLEFHILFRQHTGSVTFDDFYLIQESFNIRLDQMKVLGGLTGDGSIAVRGHFDWHKDFLPENLRYVLTQDGFGEIPFEFESDGNGFFVSARPQTSGGVKTFRFKAFSGEKVLDEKVLQADTTHIDGKNASVWTDSSMRRVYLTSLPEIGTTHPSSLKKSVELDLARNEAESFQVLVHSAVDLNGVQLAFSDLVSDADPAVKLPASALEWQEVGFLSTPEIVEHPLEKSGCPRWFPDPLLPRKNGFVPAGQTVSFWVTVTTKPETQPGKYRGTVRMTADGDALALVEIPLTVNVFPAVIPAEGHLGSAFALMDGFLEKVYGKDCDLPALRKTYDAFMVKYRLAPEGDISRTEMPSIERLQEWNGKGLGYFNILNMVRKRGDWPWCCNSPLGFYTPENREKFLAELRPYIERLRELKLTDHAYIYTFDESNETMHPAMKDFFGMVKENFPEIPTFTTAYIGVDTQKMKELNVDWVCPLTPSYNREKADECRRNGQKVWSYICCGPGQPFANIMLRFPLIEGRTLGWQSFVEKYDGLLYWGVNIWDKEDNVPIDPEKTLFLEWNTGWKHGPKQIYGDGRLLYPAADGTPIGSIRLANLRDGYEDYELLYLLEQKDPELAKKLSEEAAPNPVKFTHDPEVIRELKRKVLEAL